MRNQPGTQKMVKAIKVPALKLESWIQILGTHVRSQAL